MDWMKYRNLYFLISAFVIAVGIFSLIKWGLRPGVDFKGGALIEYAAEKSFSTEDATRLIEKEGIGVNSIQKTSDRGYLFRLNTLKDDDNAKILKLLGDLSGGKVEELRFENVGPSVGPDLIKKTIFAMIIAALIILLWIAYQFKSIRFGVSAILATLHDSLVVIGLYSIFGHFWGAEVDFLFVTALLTILSFSVHDTIVVYDRVRELQKKAGEDFLELANRAVSETMVRSLNNSFTIIFMLVALVLLGGSTIKWFSVTLLVGTISGTYSSPFVAVPLLVTWDELVKKIKK